MNRYSYGRIVVCNKYNRILTIKTNTKKYITINYNEVPNNLHLWASIGDVVRFIEDDIYKTIEIIYNKQIKKDSLKFYFIDQTIPTLYIPISKIVSIKYINNYKPGLNKIIINTLYRERSDCGKDGLYEFYVTEDPDMPSKEDDLLVVIKQSLKNYSHYIYCNFISTPRDRRIQKLVFDIVRPMVYIFTDQELNEVLRNIEISNIEEELTINYVIWMLYYNHKKLTKLEFLTEISTYIHNNIQNVSRPQLSYYFNTHMEEINKYYEKGKNTGYYGVVNQLQQKYYKELNFLSKLGKDTIKAELI